MPTMRAAGTARCGRRPKRWRSWGCATASRTGAPVGYGESVRIGEVEVGFVPAGHVLGSAQIVLEYRGEKVVVSGDYKRRPDPTCAPFVPVPCDIFITEATFGLPVFRHPDTGSEIDRLLHRLHAEPERCVLVGAYALGKAQRVITELRARGHDAPIYYHGAMERLCRLYEELGVRARRSAAGSGGDQGRAAGAGSSFARRARSTTAGRGGCPIR